MPETTHDEIIKLQAEYDKNPEGRLFVHLAEAYRKSGELKRARDLLQQGLRNHENYLSARIVLAEVQAELGEQDEARATWQEVLGRDAENEVALRALAKLEEDAGHTDEALAHYRRLVELGFNGEIKAKVAELERAEADRSPAVSAAEPARPEQPREAREAKEPARTAARRVEREITQVHLVEPPAPPQTDVIALSDLLVRLLEYRDSTFHAESSLTRLLALAIGRELELDQTHLDGLALAALLSDLGGLTLTPPQDGAATSGEVSEEQRRAQQREVAISLQLLQGVSLPAGVQEAIRHQHERWDGTGYPDGLRDEEIPYSARVLAIARTCSGMLTSRGAQAPRTVREALDDLQRQSGTRFDPVLVNVLRRVFQRRSEHGIGYGLGGRVLIVHPAELRNLGLATQLHSNGYITEMAPDTGAARERLRRVPIKALVVGANLPGTDPVRLIREVRSQAGASPVPVIVIDADDVEKRVELLTSGADICFATEVSFKEFKATLDALLRRTEDEITAHDGPTRAPAKSA